MSNNQVINSQHFKCIFFFYIYSIRLLKWLINQTFASVPILSFHSHRLLLQFMGEKSFWIVHSTNRNAPTQKNDIASEGRVTWTHIYVMYISWVYIWNQQWSYSWHNSFYFLFLACFVCVCFYTVHGLLLFVLSHIIPVYANLFIICYHM